MLEQIFLVKQDVEKYRMLTVIKSLPPREVNLSNISSRLQFTYQKTYNIFQALLEDLADVAPDIDPSDTKIESINFSKISIDTYRLYLVKNSVVFQAFNYGLTSANPSFESFSNDHFTSKSTLNRRMSKFRAFLKNFGLKISNSTLEIKGNEKNIRWMAYYVYWYTYHGQEWPFGLIQENSIDQIIARSGITFDNLIVHFQLKYFLAISRIRLIKRNYIDDLPYYSVVFGDQMLGGDLLTHEDYPIVPVDALDSENKLINLFSKTAFQPSDTAFEQPINANARINPKFYALVYHFIDFLKEHYHDDMTVYHDQKTLKHIMTYVTRDIVFYYIMAPYSIMHLDTMYSNDEERTYTDLYKDIYKFFSNVDQNEFPGVYNAAELISRNLFQVLPSYISTIRQEDIINVKVLIDPGNQAAEVVLRNIKTLGFVNVVPSVIYKNVDVLITSLDVLPLDIEQKKYPENLKVIPWDISSTRPDYIWLLVPLNQVYVKKMKRKIDSNKKKKAL
ncbi:helix-turn-helix domain-containing protein [Companilactobacillus kimchiensis]|uniref:Transcriptional regulator n=1 Tax=Companilactobacillus kimchiensis TaxID=993692 RepID=A0A0R2LJT6_9LACO|nr:helix-turn-helix domain-containing protein [Companilactobacillus kimchiensis]KRO00412.1 transcriptional regulator [Companilactobacillus kimchiensis]